MKAKKGKQLAQELIADLLGEDDGDKKGKAAETTKKAAPVDDSTVRLSDSKVTAASTVTPIDQGADKHVGGSVQAGAFGASSAALAQSENLRIAQQKIIALESEMERLRHENEALAAAADTLRKRTDELLADSESSKLKFDQVQESLTGENEILESSLKSKEREVTELKMKEEEFERRLSTNIQKIRVRERELENRLEMVKVESSALIRAKDEMILDLKRQLDQMNYELENYRNKSSELNKHLGEKQAMLQRTVRALRIALSMLEGDRASSEENKPQKKKG